MTTIQTLQDLFGDRATLTQVRFDTIRIEGLELCDLIEISADSPKGLYHQGRSLYREELEFLG